MSQNFNTGGTNEGQRATGGAGTGATDAGTTRDTGTTGGTGSTGATGTGLTTGGGGGGTGGTGTGTATGLAATAQEYGQRIAGAATQAKDYVADKMTPVVDKIKDIQNVDIGEVTTQAKDYARQNPGQAILISAAAGFLLGILIRSTRR
ncbi:MAG TPA: DUF883 C-terminal domain-containing protein [Pyrinomonadaceae bacterium]|jgi:ElaB/YqjD/DUF883 family membrane-anchored ribosome-binding protein